MLVVGAAGITIAGMSMEMPLGHTPEELATLDKMDIGSLV